MAINKQKLLEALRAAREKHTAELQPPAPRAAFIGELIETPKYFTAAGWPLNEEQCMAVKYAEDGQSFCLIGPAGSGKTTTLTEVVSMCIKSIGAENLRHNSIAIVAFTRRATANVARAMEKINAVRFCKTIHKFLDYSPEFIDYCDPTTGQWKKSRQFVPRVTEFNPSIETKIVIIEESSMVGYSELYKQLRLACPNAIFIFVGDLNQLKPVFGDSCLGFKLNQLPVVELTQIYRQAMESPIVAFQHNFVLKGRYPSEQDLVNITAGGELKFYKIARSKDEPETVAFRIWNKFLKPQIISGEFDPETDMVLCPNNSRCGQQEFNNYIADYLSKKAGETVYEVIAGIKSYYLAPGDNIQVDKRDAKIIEILDNPKYRGKKPRAPSKTIDRWGAEHVDFSLAGTKSTKAKDLDEFYLAADPDSLEDQDKAPASHVVSVVWADDDSATPVTLSTKGELSGISFNYAMTVHRAQGCEWRKVILLLPPHSARGPLLSRELLYTGMTRARKYLDVLYVPNTKPGAHDGTIDLGIKRQSIPGRTWQEKAKHFECKLEGLEWTD